MEDQRTNEPRREDDRTLERLKDADLSLDRMKFVGDWVKWLFAMIVAAILSYSATTNRITTLEVKQEANQQRLQRIEDKIDKLLERPRSQ